MISSGRIFERSLKKAICKTCEYGFHIEPVTDSDIIEFYNTDYDLGVSDTLGDNERAKTLLKLFRKASVV